jgi:3',5'-cyclic AMP phosphodiesterase CpdA
LSLGLWPGCARFAGNGRGGSFSFVVINDAHYQSPKCGAWFERVAASIKSHNPKPEACLMVGDLAEHGTPNELGAMRDALRSFGTPYHAVIGNHDYANPIDRRPYEELFPRSINYHFIHRGWQFIGLDSSEGIHFRNTRIQPATFKWLDETLPKLDRARPTVVFTHFPLGDGVPMRPMNADALLTRLLDFNLVAVYNGHFHGFTERLWRRTALTTNKCCAISRSNHDGTKENGYFLCAASPGGIQREFIEVKPG